MDTRMSDPEPVPPISPEMLTEALAEGEVEVTPEVVATLIVYGTPKAQGSGTALVSKSTGQSFKKYPASSVAWRNTLVDAFVRAGVEMVEASTPVKVAMEFYYDRPKSHSRRRRHTDGRLKTTAPDIDKLARAVLDALVVAKVIGDDRQVCDLMVSKRYVLTDIEPEGVKVTVSVLNTREQELH